MKRCLNIASALAVAALLAVSVSACSSFTGGSPLALLDQARTAGGQIAEATADKAAETIDLYCTGTPKQVREKLRAAVNSRTKKGDIAITCVGDEVATSKGGG